MVSWLQLGRRTPRGHTVGKKEAANEAEAQFMAWSKPRVYRFRRHSSARFRLWRRLTGTDQMMTPKITIPQRREALRKLLRTVLLSDIISIHLKKTTI